MWPGRRPRQPAQGGEGFTGRTARVLVVAGLSAVLLTGCSGPNRLLLGRLGEANRVVVEDPWGARTVIRIPYQVHNLVEMAEKPDFVNQGPLPCDGPLYKMWYYRGHTLLATVRTDGEGCLYLHVVHPTAKTKGA